MRSSIHPVAEAPGSKTPMVLVAAAHWSFWLLAASILTVPAWLFGGNGSAGYYWIVWTGRLCIVPLLLWATSSALQKKMPGPSFWVPLVCWSLLALQIVASTYNRSSILQAPWVGTGFDPLPHREHLPSTAFRQATQIEGWLWLSLGLLALTGRNIGMSAAMKRALLWILVVNATVLAGIGIPYKFSGEMLILGRHPAPEWYFYSTFLYHNHWCAFALLALAAAVALCLHHHSRFARAGLVFAGSLIAASAPLSKSRMGSLMMAAFIAATVLALLWRSRVTVQKVRQLGPVVALVILVLAIVGGGGAYFYRTHGKPGGHRTWSSILHSNPFGIRQTLVEDTIPMLRDKPWFGWGLGGYAAAFRFYQRAETRIVHNQGRVTLYEHAHNDWLERLTELGFVGFGLFLAPGALWLSTKYRTRPWPTVDRWMLLGCFGLLLFALGDMVFVSRAVAASFAVLFPLFLGVETPGKDKGIPE